VPAASGAGTTDGSMAAPTERRPDVAKSNNTAFMVVGAAIGILLAAGAAAYKFGNLGTDTTTTAALTPSVPVEPPASTPATPTTVLTPAETQGPSVSPLPQERTVKLVVFPENAKVEVGGQSAKVRNGVVEITGPLGSVHKVRLVVGTKELEEDVVVTDIGAQPPKVELDPKRGAGALPGAKPGTTTSPVAPPTPTAKPGIEQEFE
jgi:serine/threonine-protein kinase